MEEAINEIKKANAIGEKTASYIEAALKNLEPAMRGLLDFQDCLVKAVKMLQATVEPSPKALEPVQEDELG